jgi:hypothetical protein
MKGDLIFESFHSLRNATFQRRWCSRLLSFHFRLRVAFAISIFWRGDALAIRELFKVAGLNWRASSLFVEEALSGFLCSTGRKPRIKHTSKMW